MAKRQWLDGQTTWFAISQLEVNLYNDECKYYVGLEVTGHLVSVSSNEKICLFMNKQSYFVQPRQILSKRFNSAAAYPPFGFFVCFVSFDNILLRYITAKFFDRSSRQNSIEWFNNI